MYTQLTREPAVLNTKQWTHLSSCVFEEPRTPYQETAAPLPFEAPKDAHENNFIPSSIHKQPLPKELKDPFLHLCALLSYQSSFGWPQHHELYYAQGSWQELDTLGVIALVDSNMDGMMRVMKHYTAVTERAFIDYHTLKKNSNNTYTVQAQSGQAFTVSDVFLLSITLPHALTFIRKTSDVTEDEQFLLTLLLKKHPKLFLDEKEIVYMDRPLWLRYVHMKQSHVQPSAFWRQDMKAIIYF